MSKKVKPQDGASGAMDYFKWTLVLVLLVAGVTANYHYEQVSVAVRSAIGLLALIVVLALAAWTSAGRRALSFIRAARQEIRKVVWPTRREAVQTALIVVVMVAVMALILWGVDALFLWLIGWVTGQRG